MSQCNLYKKCINYVQARHIVTNKNLGEGYCFQMNCKRNPMRGYEVDLYKTGEGYCFQMNCKRNPMRGYEVDLYKTEETLTEEEIKRIKAEEEIKRRAQQIVEEKIPQKKKNIITEPVTIEETQTKIPKKYHRTSNNRRNTNKDTKKIWFSIRNNEYIRKNIQ